MFHSVGHLMSTCKFKVYMMWRTIQGFWYRWFKKAFCKAVRRINYNVCKWAQGGHRTEHLAKLNAKLCSHMMGFRCGQVQANIHTNLGHMPRNLREFRRGGIGALEGTRERTVTEETARSKERGTRCKGCSLHKTMSTHIEISIWCFLDGESDRQLIGGRELSKVTRFSHNGKSYVIQLCNYNVERSIWLMVLQRSWTLEFKHTSTK